MYRVMAGIDTDEKNVGYKRIVIKPHIGGKLTKAEATLTTYYGKVKSAWHLAQGKLIFDVDIPVNTKAVIYIPARETETLRETGRILTEVKDLIVKGQDGNYRVVEVGSGTYRFTVD
jgi:alpha-L-rhamnosidase